VIEHLRDEHLDSYLANLEQFRDRSTSRASNRASQPQRTAAKRRPPQSAASARQPRKRTATR
jgi:hypothetical protein